MLLLKLCTMRSLTSWLVSLFTLSFHLIGLMIPNLNPLTNSSSSSNNFVLFLVSGSTSFHFRNRFLSTLDGLMIDSCDLVIELWIVVVQCFYYFFKEKSRSKSFPRWKALNRKRWDTNQYSLIKILTFAECKEQRQKEFERI